MQKSILLTLGLFIAAIAALSAITAQEPSSHGVSIYPVLPEDILAGEIDYEARQQAIENDLRRWQLSHLHESGEMRRVLYHAWMEQKRAVLEDQAARSEALDALYVLHRIPEEPKLSELLEVVAPRTAEEAQAPIGRRWALDHDLTLIRENNAYDPEALRKAIYEWSQANEAELAAVDEAVRTEANRHVAWEPLSSKAADSGILPHEELPEGAPEYIRQIFALQGRLRDSMAANPSPVWNFSGLAPSVQDCQVWRASFMAENYEQMETLQNLQEQLAKGIEYNLSSEYSYELTK